MTLYEYKFTVGERVIFALGHTGGVFEIVEIDQNGMANLIVVGKATKLPELRSLSKVPLAALMPILHELGS